MKLTAFIQHNFSARHMVLSGERNESGQLIPIQKQIIQFGYRPTGTTNIRLITDEFIPPGDIFMEIRNKHGDIAFPISLNSDGETWAIYHCEAIYDLQGNLQYYYSHAQKLGT